MDKSKSDRPTIFLSFLNGTAEEMYELQKALEKSGLPEDYRFMLTAKPMQVMSEQEALQIASDILKQEVPIKSELLLEKILLSLQNLGRAIEGIEKELVILHENDKDLSHAVSNFSHQIAMHTKGSTVQPIPLRRTSGYFELQAAITQLQKIIPKEGESWLNEKL